jgi:hypothetical protein
MAAASAGEAWAGRRSPGWCESTNRRGDSSPTEGEEDVAADGPWRAYASEAAPRARGAVGRAAYKAVRQSAA